ncbi:MAG: exodeoxyribonuclease V subunit gamma, partial [Solirubrobacteraceae bacterium]
AERLADAAAGLREDAGVVDLPERLSLFGLTRLPAGHLAVLRAIAAHRDVHLFLLHPSPALWERVADTVRPGAPIVRRSEDHTATLAANRLLASWGQDAREMQLVLVAADDDDGVVDHHHPAQHPAATLLGRIQADVRADAPAPGPPLPGDQDRRAALDPHDPSLQVHACHGRARQVEVLRDALLHLLQDDESLEPRDVIVMCPDIETFAPLIHATFGAGEVLEEDDDDEDQGASPAGLRSPDLRVRLADRSLRQTNPVLGVIADVIELAQRRVTASQVLDLADREPVRRRFGFDDDDLARIEEWVARSGIRWGLDAAHRAPYRLDALGAGTWSAGMDRILLGVAMTEEDHRLFGDALPLDDVESGAIDLAGRLAELVARLTATLDALGEPMTIDAWAATIARAARALTATAPPEAWQQAELQRLLDDVVDEAAVGGAPATLTLSLPEVRALLAGRLQGRPTRANFRTGHLTVCTLMPMRSVPHRVVCLLGLDDDVFPRKSPRDGDDLMLDDQHVGERDARSEDRQLLLDALMAATDRLIVTYTGNDERTNAVRPPAVPIGELLDVVDATVRSDEAAPRDQVVIRHPLQPFDPRNFTAGALRADGAWSFDRVTLDGARALAGERVPPAPFLSGPLPDTSQLLVEVDHLVRFVQRPARAFLRLRLGITVGDFSDELDDALPVALDHLEQWGIGQRLLEARLAGVGIEDAIRAERARGTLPPGELAAAVIDPIRPVVERIAAGAASVLGDGGSPASVDVRVALGDGRALSGTVAGLHGDVLSTVGYSRVSPRHRLATWVRWLGLTAARPERPFMAVTLGRARYGAPRDADVTIARLPPAPGDAAARRAFALAHLADLLDLFARGMREPLPLACLASAAYAQAAPRGVDAAVKAAQKEWVSEWNRDREDKDPEHRLVLGDVVPFAHLLDQPPRADEHGEGWEATEPTRFGRYARRLWAGLLACEEVEDR